MHDLQEEPVLWLVEFLIGMAHVAVVTVLTGLWTLLCIRLPVPNRSKLFFNVAGVGILSLYASTIFDARTHILGSVSAAISMAFTAPLQAAAWVTRKTSKPDDNTSGREIMLRIAIPGALPTAHNPAERPRIQLIRGVIYLVLGDLTRPVFFALLDTPGLKQDLLGMWYVICIAIGALNVASAILGAFGVPTACPFRRPLLSRSLNDFWGRRWNAPVSDALRTAIYDPMRKAGWRKDVASMACFFASAAAHELVLWYCGVRVSQFEWFMFFFLSGVVAGIERKISKRLGKVGTYVFAVGSFYLLFHLFFLDITVRSGFAERGVQAVGTFGFLVKKGLLSVANRYGVSA